MMDAKALQLAALNLQIQTVDVLETVRELVTQIDALIAERVRIAAVLADFYVAALSISSVAPLLALAVELNPSLVSQWTGAQRVQTNTDALRAAASAKIPLSARPCGCDVSAGWVCEQHRS